MDFEAGLESSFILGEDEPVVRIEPGKFSWDIAQARNDEIRVILVAVDEGGSHGFYCNFFSRESSDTPIDERVNAVAPAVTELCSNILEPKLS